MKTRELVSGYTHFVGVLLSIAGLCVLLDVAITRGTPWHIVSFAIFGASLILLYTASTLYHLLPHVEHGTGIFRKLDHMMIFVLIAGTYTPFCLVPLRGPWGWSLLGSIWGLGIAGVVGKCLWMRMPRWVSTLIYILMGWLILVAVYPLIKTLPLGGLHWLFIGGLCYSGGAVIYGLKWPKLWPGCFGFHEVWHLFVLAGSISHFWAIFHYISPLT